MDDARQIEAILDEVMLC